MQYRHLLWTALIFPSLFVASATADDLAMNPEVAWALDYQIPKYKCKKPTLRQSNQTADQFARFERKSKQFAKCVADYQTEIIDDHARIVAAAETGITQEQADVMFEKLREIEAVVVRIGESSITPLDPSEAQRSLTLPSRSSI